MTAAVRLEIAPGVIEVDAPAGYDLDALAAGIAPLWPALSRALAPPLPPADEWPEHWRELHAERVAIAEEGGATDPEAVADGDLRLMYWRELCEIRTCPGRAAKGRAHEHARKRPETPGRTRTARCVYAHAFSALSPSRGHLQHQLAPSR